MPKVFLSPATHEKTCNVKGCNEAKHNALICDAMIPYLDACGIEWKRNDSSTAESMDHVRASNAYEPDVHFTFHTNAGGGKRCTFYNSGSTKSKQLSEVFAARFRAVYPNLVKPSDSYPPETCTENWNELKLTKAPAVYAEQWFHDNADDSEWGHAHIKETAKSHVKALCDWFGIKFVDIDAGEAQPTEPLYTRQVNTPGDTLNVRDEANAKGTKLGELAHGSTVEVYGLADNGWALIQQGSLRGWVNGKYLVEPKKTFAPYIVRVTADALNIRKGPGTNYDVAGCIRDKGSYTIVDEQDGWGRLKSGAGWISLAYTTKAGDAGTKPELTRILKLTSPNMRGEDVRWAQERLNELGYNCGTPDGIFGPNTDKAVKAFQRANGLSQDGDIGPKTWAKL